MSENFDGTPLVNLALKILTSLNKLNLKLRRLACYIISVQDENQIVRIFYVSKVKNEDSFRQDKNHFSAGKKDQSNAKVRKDKKYIGQNMARAADLSPIRRKIWKSCRMRVAPGGSKDTSNYRLSQSTRE